MNGLSGDWCGGVGLGEREGMGRGGCGGVGVGGVGGIGGNGCGGVEVGRVGGDGWGRVSGRGAVWGGRGRDRRAREFVLARQTLVDPASQQRT